MVTTKMHNIILYEDNLYSDFYPLTYLRPAWDLKCGAFSLRQRIAKYYKFGKACQHWVGKDRIVFSNPGNESKETTILINGRAFIAQNDFNSLIKSKGNSVILVGGTIAALKLENRGGLGKALSLEPTEKLLQQLAEGAREIKAQSRLFNFLWEMVDFNGKAIEHDAVCFKSNTVKLPQGSYIIGKRNNLKISAKAVIEPGVVMDLRQGPVIIESGAVIRPFSFIKGPCYIGPDSLIDGAKIHSGVSAGQGCKLSGEIEQSIILDYSNKHHDGFLGHSYLGSWINLGAQTCNSDLKNNYGTVVVWVNGKYIDSKQIKAGCYIGDHTKTAIGTMINTGAVIGVCCNIFGGQVKKYLPSFSWGASDKFLDHQLPKALETCKTVMMRRGHKLDSKESSLFEKIFVETSADRQNLSGRQK